MNVSIVSHRATDLQVFLASVDTVGFIDQRGSHASSSGQSDDLAVFGSWRAARGELAFKQL